MQKARYSETITEKSIELISYLRKHDIPTPLSVEFPTQDISELIKQAIIEDTPFEEFMKKISVLQYTIDKEFENRETLQRTLGVDNLHGLLGVLYKNWFQVFYLDTESNTLNQLNLPSLTQFASDGGNLIFDTTQLIYALIRGRLITADILDCNNIEIEIPILEIGPFLNRELPMSLFLDSENIERQTGSFISIAELNHQIKM